MIRAHGHDRRVKISELGQFPLIEKLAAWRGAQRVDVVVGSGDDAAVLDLGGEEWALLKVDSQLEGVHFRRAWIAPRELGRRALVVALSDIAAMGGWPTHALVSTALPASLDVSWVEELAQGLHEEARLWDVAVVGGHVSRSPQGVLIDVTVLGRVPRGRVLLRSGARAGDLVLVTGTLGDAAAGLRILQEPHSALPEQKAQFLRRRFLAPSPRLREAQILAASGHVTAMIDLSDGLASDLRHLCKRSGVGARLYADRLPVSSALMSLAALWAKPPWELALAGGEDYELLFAAPAETAEALAHEVQEKTGTAVTVIGEIVPAEQGLTLVQPDGGEVPLPAGGFRHF